MHRTVIQIVALAESARVKKRSLINKRCSGTLSFTDDKFSALFEKCVEKDGEEQCEKDALALCELAGAEYGKTIECGGAQCSVITNGCSCTFSGMLLCEYCIQAMAFNA